MEVRALCIRLVGITLLLLVAHVHLSDSQKTVAAFPKVAPNRQQHFEYGTIVVSCEGLEGLTGWRVMKKIKEVFLTCASTSAGPCEITNTFSIDSGEYWCEHQDVKRSNTVNITVTAGSVILESPVLPVMEGEAVNLSCRNKMASGNLIADFFKDGVHIRTSVTGALPIHSVSKSDEGLYKCNISGAGESPESWMTVKVINVAVLLPAQVQHSYSHRAEATFPRIVPSRLQFFEYESFSVNCKGFFHDLTKWRVMRNIKGTNTTCKDKCEMRGTYNITAAFSIDSGEYWCEVDGKKSNKVNIIVTEGSVILDSPALPVMEGDNVVLRCKNKKTFRIEADFYKNGVLMESSSTGEMIIHSVSKSDEGLYKCNISGIGESAESWLAVRAYQEETPLPQSHSPRFFILLCTVITILLVALLLLLVVGLHYMKQSFMTSHPSFPMSSPLQTDKDESLTKPAYYTLSIGPGESSSAATPVPSASINQLLNEDDRFYYTFN